MRVAPSLRNRTGRPRDSLVCADPELAQKAGASVGLECMLKVRVARSRQRDANRLNQPTTPASPTVDAYRIVGYQDGFIGAARTALTKLGVHWEPTESEIAYQEGRTSEIPAAPAVRIRRRFSRRLSFGQTELVVER